MTRSRSALVGLTLLAALLHFHALDAQSLWYDEGFSVWLAQKPPAEIVARTAADIQPPLYYLLLHAWIALTGQSEFALRAFSALCGIVAVPLMGQAAWGLLRQRQAQWIAALLVAISPLWLWYGREVRMYAWVLALLLAAIPPLLALLRGRRRAAVPVALLLTAAVYSHYFGWFVAGAWAIVALVRAWRSRDRSRLTSVVTAFGLPVLAYLPWVGIVLTRLSEDRSYWAGTLNTAEVIRDALASWMAGHSMLEGDAVLAGGYGALLALAGLALLVGRVQHWQEAAWPLTEHRPWVRLPRAHLALIALWLVGPMVGLLLLSWNRPKYHPRYLIFAAPAFLLLHAGLLSWLWRRRWAGKLLGAVLSLSVIALSAVADWHLFTDPAFAKDDWRGVARYLAEHRQPNEPIVLVSGHTFPVFHYYYPDEANVIRLPDRPTLDTTAVLGPETSGELAASLNGVHRAWVVGWEDEVVDPEGVVPTFLHAAGGMEQPQVGFMNVRLSAWDLPSGANLAGVLEPTRLTDTRFGDAIRLLGWSPPRSASHADSGLAITLYWAAQRALTGDYKVNLRVIDGEGQTWGSLDQRPTAYYFPTFRWQPSVARLAALQVPLLPGTPPGDYWLLLSVYEEGGATLDVMDAAGAPQGQSFRVGPLRVEPAAGGWADAVPPADAAPIEQPLLDETTLLAVRLAPIPVPLQPGHRLPLSLWWRTDEPLSDATLHLAWEQGGGPLDEQSLPPGGPAWPSEAWPRGTLLLTQTTMTVPRTLAAGEARLVAWLTDGEGRKSDKVTLAQGEAAAIVRRFEPPPFEVPQAATFGDEIALLGYDLSASLAPGGSTGLTLHWQALADPPTSYTVFAHLLTEDGHIVPHAGQDTIPLDGTRPTDSWVAGEVVSTPLTLSVPADAPPGPYQIEVGWYNAALPDFPRLPATGKGADGNRVILER